MINHHWLRIRELRTQIFNCGVSTCSYYRIYVRKCQAKISNSSYVAALFQCRSYPGVSPQRCLAPILAKSYPIFWQVCTCQAARFHTANIHSLNSGQNKSTVRCQPHRQNFFCLKVSLLRCQGSLNDKPSLAPHTRIENTNIQLRCFNLLILQNICS